MDANIRENGLIIIWKVLVSIHGQTVDDMKENIRMIRNMDMASIHGQI
jgi:hypothetical protein